MGKCRNDNRKFRMFGTLGKVSIVDIASAGSKARSGFNRQTDNARRYFRKKIP